MDQVGCRTAENHHHGRAGCGEHGQLVLGMFVHEYGSTDNTDGGVHRNRCRRYGAISRTWSSPNRLLHSLHLRLDPYGARWACMRQNHTAEAFLWIFPVQATTTARAAVSRMSIYKLQAIGAAPCLAQGRQSYGQCRWDRCPLLAHPHSSPWTLHARHRCRLRDLLGVRMCLPSRRASRCARSPRLRGQGRPRAAFRDHLGYLAESRLRRWILGMCLHSMRRLHKRTTAIRRNLPHPTMHTHRAEHRLHQPYHRPSIERANQRRLQSRVWNQERCLIP